LVATFNRLSVKPALAEVDDQPLTDNIMVKQKTRKGTLLIAHSWDAGAGFDGVW